jgi:hypothetical protein
MGSSWVAFFCRKSFLNKSKKGNSGAVQTGCAFVVMQTEDHKYDYDLLQPAEGGGEASRSVVATWLVLMMKTGRARL